MPQILTWIGWQLLSYGALSWLVFLLVAYCVARYGRWWLIPVGHLAIALLIVFLDIAWIQSEMSKPDWNGLPDMDIGFSLGVLFRILLVNTVLLPITGLGLWYRRRMIKAKESIAKEPVSV